MAALMAVFLHRMVFPYLYYKECSKAPGAALRGLFDPLVAQNARVLWFNSASAPWQRITPTP